MKSKRYFYKIFFHKFILKYKNSHDYRYKKYQKMQTKKTFFFNDRKTSLSKKVIFQSFP